MFSRKQVSTLQGFSTDKELPVISLYLNVNGAHNLSRSQYETELKSMLRDAPRKAGDRLQMSREQQAAMAEELDAISEYVNMEFRREGARGLAIFSCRSAGLWEPLKLGIPVENRLFVDWEPRVAPLAEIRDAHSDLCVLVTNKETSRIFHAFAGEIKERTEIFDSVPPRHDQGGWEQTKLQRWHDLEVREHLKRASDATLDFFKREGFDSIVIGIADELWPDLERVMHPYLKERVAGRFAIDINAGADEVMARAAEVERELREREARELLESLGPELAAGKNYVGGLDDVLAVLNQRRVDTLFIEQGFKEGGRRCFSCHTLAWSEQTCPSCGNDSAPSMDIVEDAREAATRQGARVMTIAAGNEAMKQAGGIAARLRY